ASIHPSICTAAGLSCPGGGGPPVAVRPTPGCLRTTHLRTQGPGPAQRLLPGTVHQEAAAILRLYRHADCRHRRRDHSRARRATSALPAATGGPPRAASGVAAGRARCSARLAGRARGADHLYACPCDQGLSHRGSDPVPRCGRPVLMALLRRLLPSDADDIVGMLSRILRTGDRAARAEVGRTVLGTLATPV